MYPRATDPPPYQNISFSSATISVCDWGPILLYSCISTISKKFLMHFHTTPIWLSRHSFKHSLQVPCQRKIILFLIFALHKEKILSKLTTILTNVLQLNIFWIKSFQFSYEMKYCLNSFEKWIKFKFSTYRSLFCILRDCLLFIW